MQDPLYAYWYTNNNETNWGLCEMIISVQSVTLKIFFGSVFYDQLKMSSYGQELL